MGQVPSAQAARDAGHAAGRPARRPACYPRLGPGPGPGTVGVWARDRPVRPGGLAAGLGLCTPAPCAGLTTRPLPGSSRLPALSRRSSRPVLAVRPSGRAGPLWSLPRAGVVVPAERRFPTAPGSPPSASRPVPSAGSAGSGIGTGAVASSENSSENPVTHGRLPRAPHLGRDTGIAAHDDLGVHHRLDAE